MKTFLIFCVLFSFLSPTYSYISATLRTASSSEETLDIMVIFEADTKPVIDGIEAQCFPNSDVKTTELVRRLKAFTYEHQKRAIQILERHYLKYKVFWINGSLFVLKCTMGVAAMIDELEEVEEIRLANIAKTFAGAADSTPTWGVSRINAPYAWAEGCNGNGIVIGSIDTGVAYKHQDLLPNYRGGYYSWYDPYNYTGQPVDIDGHGTHTMGTIVGLRGLGVAPGAQWITCRGCYTNTKCTEDALLQCGQWILCPTYTDGTYPDCSARPKICSNSWGAGQGQTWYNAVISAWRAAEIVPVVAIGNDGNLKSCGTANSPGDQPGVISVGATDNNNKIADFSSKGPSIEGRHAPLLSAPGVDTFSAGISAINSYQTMQGTSMAAAHVSGAAAIIKGCTEKYLTFEQLVTALTTTAYEPSLTGANCVNASDPWPNDSYGWGIVDVKRALVAVRGFTYEEYNPCNQHNKYY